MKIIISRKGFDSEYGGTPSPVMPDGTMLSLPIPEDEGYQFEDISYQDITYADIWRQLKPSCRHYRSACHLDPDIRKNVGIKREENWKPIFGQISAAETHLENQNVGVGDLFLFFGWFRKTEYNNGTLRYIRSCGDAHMLYGYLQVGEIAREKDVLNYPWHPHSYECGNNAMYVAAENLVIDGKNTGLPGAGTFKYSDELVLTMPGMSRSKWSLPDCFRKVNISYHTDNSFKEEGYFQSAAKGQEFVVSDSSEITKWALELITNHIDDRV